MSIPPRRFLGRLPAVPWWAAVAAVALLARFAYLFLADEPLLFAHPYNYFNGGLSIVEHPRPLWFVLYSDTWHKWLGPWTIAPLYYLLVAAVLAVSDGHLLPLQVLQYGLDAWVAVLTALLARRLAGPRGVWAGIAYALNFHAIEQSSSTLTENLHTPLLVTALAILALELERRGPDGQPRWRWLMAGGFVMGLSGLARSVSTAFVPLAALWRAAEGRRRRDLAAAAVIVAAAMAAVLPWTARNVFLIGDFVPVESISIYNLWDDNAFVEGERRRHQEGVIAAQPTLAGQRAQALVYTWRGVSRNPGAFVEKAWRNLLHIVRLDGLHLLLRIEEPHAAWRHAALILLDDSMIAATVVLFLVFVFAGPPSAVRRLLLTWAAYYLLMVVVIFHNEIRYRSTVFPAALACAAGGAAVLADRDARRRMRVRVAVAFAFFCGAALFSPYVMPALHAARAMGPLRAARDRLFAGDRSGADGFAFAAASADRVAGRPWLRYGSWLAEAGDPEAALDAFRRAHERKSHLWTPPLVRPQLLAAAGRHDEARAALAEADAFSWHVDPWLALEVAWRTLPPPRTDEVRLARGDYGAVRGFTLPRRDYRWTRHRALIRLTPRTPAAEYEVALDMASPEPSPHAAPLVRVQVSGGDEQTFTLNRTVRRFTLRARPAAGEPILVTIDAPTWSRVGHPAEQGVRVDRLGLTPLH